MSPLRTFQSMTDDQLSEMALTLINGTITREDYHRLACWLDEGIRMADFPSGDASLTLLMSLTGKVTFAQRELLKTAISKWIGIVQQFILDEQNNMVFVAENPRQGSLKI